jgi:hypothetical protein
MSHAEAFRRDPAWSHPDLPAAFAARLKTRGPVWRSLIQRATAETEPFTTYVLYLALHMDVKWARDMFHFYTRTQEASNPFRTHLSAALALCEQAIDATQRSGVKVVMPATVQLPEHYLPR